MTASLGNGKSFPYQSLKIKTSSNCKRKYHMVRHEGSSSSSSSSREEQEEENLKMTYLDDSNELIERHKEKNYIESNEEQ